MPPIGVAATAAPSDAGALNTPKANLHNLRVCGTWTDEIDQRNDTIGL